jgi:hypothetical protein
MESRLTETHVPTRRRSRIASRAGRRLLSVAIMAGWVAMPLMPVLALAFTWLDGLT